MTTNSVEGFFSIFRRGMEGVYQHCGEQHLKRYLAEFDFRYSNRAKFGVDDAETQRHAQSKGLTANASPIGGLVGNKEARSKKARKLKASDAEGLIDALLRVFLADEF